MPNWCNNTMTISHKDPAMIARARAAWMKHSFLQEFIPCPQELIDTTEGYLGEDKQAELNAKQAANIEKYGYPTWYRFNLAKWGTKWDIGYDKDYENNPYNETPNQFTVYFDSAWSPPTDAYYALENMGFKIEATYYEGGMDFIGEFIDGDDYTYVVEGCPDHLREAYAIEELEQEEE
jgi:hypothetical protein